MNACCGTVKSLRMMVHAMALLGAGLLSAAEAEIAGNSLVVTVDLERTNGVIRPLHSANGGTISYGGLIDTSAHIREAGFPLLRLHDCQWPEPAVVDIHTIFRDFRDDPDDASNYSFTRTDDYLAAIVQTGAGICYRLGESIEHSRRKYDVHPPADFDKWAQVCLGIIRHYNDGWAKGFRHDIRYWEIWNEPEVRPQMWSGTDEDYIRMYVTTARAIHRVFPELMVGGPGSGNPGEIREGTFAPTPFVSEFLKRCAEEKVPLRFFSWHRYSDNPEDFRLLAKGVRETLDRHGFRATESHLNEWNYLPRQDWSVFTSGKPEAWEKWYAEMGSAEAAAFTACSLMTFQDAPLDMAFLYSADTQGFGVFTLYGEPRKPFYAVKAFNQMLQTPIRVPAEGGQPGASHALAGVNAERTAVQVLVSNYRTTAERVEVRIDRLPWNGPSRCEQTEISSAGNWLAAVKELPRGGATLEAAGGPGTTWLFKLTESSH